ncbi:hypothetical protein FB45DRAFT_820989 [Roridomyces roridus]|uniref:F-box domain-containing protein n=1 Tax=Roridomyces roridus TaxID=1738132 RepID=A0AAD7CDX8_9AGAR|nr:hypothetical protein FB45DRAFT_820989 [Roridomyces roridus]
MTDFRNSPFEAQLHTNFVPSDAECEQIRADLVPRLLQLELLNERIRELSAERDKLQADIDSHTALISYPRRLPVDIVREIFVACLPTNRNAVMSTQEAPLLISRICSAWREIALTTPSLWASIHVPIDFILSHPVERILALRHWLQLSGALPISLALTPGTHPFAPQFADVLHDSAARWGNVEFRTLTFEVLSALATVQTPLLESITVIGHGEFLRHHARQLLLFSAPSLRRLHLHSLGTENLEDFFLDLPFCWNNLAHLSLISSGNPGHPSESGLSPGTVLKLLRQCPLLVSLIFFPANRNDRADTSLSTSISLPFLESFILLDPCMWDLQTIGQLLQKLVTPELRQLHIQTEISSDNHHPLLSAIENIPLLETLFIHRSSFTEPAILQALRTLPDLTKLTVSNNKTWYWGQALDQEALQLWDPQRLIVLLTPRESGSTLCPRLQELAIHCDSMPSTVATESFIRKRAGLGSGFRRLEVRWQEPKDAELFSDEAIQEFRSQGVEVDLIFPSQYSISEPNQPMRVTPWTGLPWGTHWH